MRRTVDHQDAALHGTESVSARPARDSLGLTEDQFKRLLALFIAGVTFFGTVVAALQVDASARSASADRDSRALILRGIGKSNAGIQRIIHERNLLASYEGWVILWALERNLARDKGLLLGALDNEQAAERAWRVQTDLRSLSELLSAPYFDEATGGIDVFQFGIDFLITPSATMAEQQAAKRAEADAWGRKSDNYIVVITVLAVCLFLFGLAITIGGRLKYLFAALGSLIADVLLIVVLVTFLLPIPHVSERTIQQYVQGFGQVYYAMNLELASAHSKVPERVDQAVASLTQAIASRPDYVAAYRSRGDAHLIKGEALLFGRGDSAQTKIELDQAIADYRQVINLGQGDKHSYTNLGWACFLAKRYSESSAVFQQALDLAPGEKLGTGLDLALSLLGQGKRAEAMRQLEASLAWAAQHPLYSDALYFRQMIRNLDQLMQVQPLEGMAETQKRLKEAFVSLVYRGTSTVKPTGASIAVFEFAQAILDAQGKVSGYKPMTRFPRGTERVDFSFNYKGIPKQSQVVQKVYWQGQEQAALTRVVQWNAGESGRAVWFVRSPVEHTLAGMFSGHYTVELYVEGELLQSGSFDIE